MPVNWWLTAQIRNSYHHSAVLAATLSGLTMCTADALAVFAAMLSSNRAHPPHERYTVIATISLWMWISAALIAGPVLASMAYTYADSQQTAAPDTTSSPLATTLFLVVFVIVGGTFVSRVFGRMLVLNKWRRRHPGDPLDEVALRLLALAAAVERAAHNREWADRRAAARTIREVRGLARMTEGAFVRRAPRSDVAARRAARGTGLALAAVIRSHAPSLLRAIGPHDYQRVSASLSAGLVAWADRDLASMLAHAPQVTIRDRIRPFLRWLWPPVVATSCAFALPWIPAIHDHSDLADSVRNNLLIIAVLAAVGAGAVNDRIAAVAGKALPIGNR
ncbi:hypothetical protein [Streptomyces sp. NPDC057072]|uniref:hypothetical protein n=1 Tax=Streptomyces sp. NPDC057072 TaxID=3346014 RepID=UPI0036407E5A